ncbi:MAG: AAA family ATPase [Victivallales bacterium]|nr:AAA family ATPase [Victivallales bacterium]
MVKETSKLIDMHNRISATQLGDLLRMQVNTLTEQPELAHVLPPMMVWGAPGLGKSTIIRDVANEFGIGFIDVRLAQREPVDVRGLPVPDRENRRVDWMVSGEWPREGRGILLFDELTAADRSLQVAAYELILDRRLGYLYKVPDGWYICAAGNRVDDSAVATTFSSALANRFMHVELVEDVTAWGNWATTHGIHPSVTGFLRFRPECLFRQQDENLERGWPTPRAWERVSVMLGVLSKSKGAMDEGLLRSVVYGLVGPRAGIEFVEYHKLNAEFDDVRAMMMNPTEKVNIPSKVDRKFAFCSAMSYFLWRGETEQESKALLDGFFRISLKLSSDFACMAMCDAMSGGGKVSTKEATHKLFYHPMYGEWAKLHGTALKKHHSF